MDYKKDILSKLVDKYEGRGAFNADASVLRAIQIDIKKEYPNYANRYDYDVYTEINVAVEKLCEEGLVIAEKNNTGQYTKVKLKVSEVSKAYARLSRISIPEKCDSVKKVLLGYLSSDEPMLQSIVSDWMGELDNYKKLPYNLAYDSRRIDEVLNVLREILRLDKETYIRNFSTAIFKDSKRFKKEFEDTVKSILFDYTDDVVEKKEILGYYNLYENPTYVWIKGNAVIEFDSSVIKTSEMPDGIALSNTSLENIRRIIINTGKVITVENLTTYHDSDDEDAVHIYLGGYHNHAKQVLLEKIYDDNRDKKYYHKGDLDVYGFLILENLKTKTGIPFEPLEMDVKTLEKFYHAGLYKELSAQDIKVIKAKRDNLLAEYADVLEFMIDNNCKAEQESVKALELMDK